ncbi:hypothetical protein [Metamycoplasma buccale]|uniref:hypothetical protein n=1 Tax=Metamycoplasma buccale TaxID=55602 RepID=UPI00398F2703
MTLNTLSTTLLILTFISILINGLIIGLSFKKDLPKATINITILFAGFLIGMVIYGIFALVLYGSLLKTLQLVPIMLFVFWLVALVGTIGLGVVHLIRVFFNKRSFYNHS